MAGLGCPQDPSSMPTIDMVKASRVYPASTGWGFLNVQGLRHKVHEIRDLVKTQDLEVLGLAETWLVPGEEVRLAGFKWVGAAREGQVGRGGVGVLIKDDWTVADEVSLSSKGIESIWVSVGHKGVADTLLGVVYFTPHCGERCSIRVQR